MNDTGFSRTKARKWWVAAILSFLQPGLGQVYNGQALKGIVFFIGIWVVLVVPTFVLLVRYLSLSTLLAILALAVAIPVLPAVDAIVNARRAGAGYRLKPYNRVLVYAGIFVVCTLARQADSWLVRTYITQAFRIPSASMAPTLLPGDGILVDKLHGSKQLPRRGEIVVFNYPADPTKEFVKRVEAVAGDTVEIRNKDLYLNGTLVKAHYTVHSDRQVVPALVGPRDNFGPATVPKDSVFVLGDNRDHSLDSRFFGFVDQTKIRGVAKCIYFSRDRGSRSIRWNRIGRRVR